MKIIDRLYEYIEHKGISLNAFDKSIEASNGYIGRQIKNKASVGGDVIEKISCVYTDLNLDWLITGQGSMLKSDQVSQTIPAISNNDKDPQVSIYQLKTDYLGTNRQAIPLYELEAAAGLSTLFSSQIKQVPLDYITVPNAPKCDGALFVRGDSMYPILKSGDIICYKHIEKIDDIYWGEMYLLDIEVSGDQYLTLKYVQKSDLGDDFIKLVSHNSHHNPKDVQKKDIRAIALIKISIRYNTLS